MIKINIILGFLGAGKTTLIKRILKDTAIKNEKVILIENEFGEIGIDGTLVKNEGIKVYEITNGCICCTLKDDFKHTLTTVVKEVKPDRIIIEPSGIFIPNLVLDLLASPEFYSICKVSSIVNVVDCINFIKHEHKYGYFFEKQISVSHILILSKMQLLSETDVNALIYKLNRIKPSANIIAKNWEYFESQDINYILNPDTECFDIIQNQTVKDFSQNHNLRYCFEVFGKEVFKVFDKKTLENILASLNDPVFGNIIRGKGIVKSYNHSLEFNYVNGQYSVNLKPATKTGMVSFIGENINSQRLKHIFDSRV